MSDGDEQRKWQIGDLCTCEYGGVGHGIIYRVTHACEEPNVWDKFNTMLSIVPVHGVMTSIARKGKRRISSKWCEYVSLVEMGTAYATFGTFIAEEARKLGAKP